MLNDFLTPVNEELKNFAESQDRFSIGNFVKFDLDESAEEKAVVIIGVKETRGAGENCNSKLDFFGIRKALYQLRKGDWDWNLYDLGDIEAGADLSDTYYAFLKIQQEILKQKKHLIILGGTSDLIYHQYRAFDGIKHNINLTTIDNRFRLGDDSEELSPQNYLSKIISDKPYNLFEYTHLGGQVYFVAQEELDLMEQLNFGVQRLGKLTKNLTEAEPELRMSDAVAINLESMQASDFQSAISNSPNGFSAREICALARYSGLNNRVKSLGIYNYKSNNILTDEFLFAEILWYYIEGKNSSQEIVSFDDDSFEKFYVQMPEQEIIFFRNIYSNQWWMQIDGLNEIKDNPVAIAGSESDYRKAISGEIPERWWKAYKKLY